MKNHKIDNGSAYWNWIYNHQHYNKGSVELWEPIEANPDQSSDELLNRRDEQDFRQEMISASFVKEIFKRATRREKDVIKLLQKGYNQNKIAKKLRLSIGAVNTLVARVREKATNLVYRKAKWGELVNTRKLV